MIIGGLPEEMISAQTILDIGRALNQPSTLYPVADFYQPEPIKPKVKKQVKQATENYLDLNDSFLRTKEFKNMTPRK